MVLLLLLVGGVQATAVLDLELLADGGIQAAL